MRQRLLDSAMLQANGPITVIHGPAGFGKSAFMAQWHAAMTQSGQAARWITLNPRHRSPGAFASALLLALEAPSGDEFAGEGAVGADTKTPERALELMTRGAAPCTLFLDGFETAACDEIDRLLTAVVAAPRPPVHVVIGTRVRPRFVCERLRLQGRVREIGADDLRFDAAECERLLDMHGRGDLLRAEITEAEGWPIAVDRLAALRTGDEQAVCGNQPASEWRRSLANYFLEETVALLPAELGNLLTDLSILEAVTPELCDFVRQQTRSASLLHDLQNQYALLYTAGARTRLLRLHRSALLAELTTSEPRRAAQLHRRASAWHEQRVELVQAVHHALAAGDSELAGKIIERAGGIRLAFRAGPNIARDLLGRIPKSLQLSHPRIACLKAYILLKDGEIEGARALAQIAGASRVEAAKDRDFLVDKAMLDALFAMDAGPVEETVDVLNTAAEFEPVSATEIESVCALRDGYAHQEAGLLHRASVELNRAINLSGLLEWDYSLLYAQLLSGAIAAPQGQLQAARSAHLRTLECAERNYAGRHGLHHAARVLLAEVEYLTGRIGEARELAPRDIRDIEQCNCWYDIRAACYSLDLRLARLAGADAQKIAARVERIRRHAADHELQELDQLAVAEGVSAMLLLGDVREAAVLLKQLAIDADAALSLECVARPWRGDDSIQRALALHALLTGDALRAGRLAAKWAARARNEGRVPSLISALMLQALALDAQDKSTEAFANAREAMALAAETGAVQAMLDLPTVHLRGLLERTRNADERLAQLAQPVLDRLRSPASVSGFDAPYSGALSDREILVLRGLQRGESNKVIARTLRISENTVKFHAKNVFRKLGISGRRDVRAGTAADRSSPRVAPAGP